MSEIDFSELPELKPCPFCGNQFGAHEDHAFIETQGTKWGQVNCCNAEVRTGYGPLSDWIEDAIEAWNTRPIEDELRKRIRKLKGALKIGEELRIHYQNESFLDRKKLELMEVRYSALLDKLERLASDPETSAFDILRGLKAIIKREKSDETSATG